MPIDCQAIHSVNAQRKACRVAKAGDARRQRVRMAGDCVVVRKFVCMPHEMFMAGDVVCVRKLMGVRWHIVDMLHVVRVRGYVYMVTVAGGDFCGM